MTGEGIEFTVFRKDNGPLTKRIWLGEDGLVKSNDSACVMPRGRAQRVFFKSMAQFGQIIDELPLNQALATGCLRHDLPVEVQVVTKRKLNGAADPGVIARTQEYLVYRSGSRALALLDFDTKGMSAAVSGRIQSVGGVWEALVEIIPTLAKAARVERASTSAGLFNSQTGEQFHGSGGSHFYVLIKDGVDAERFLKAFHDRCWLAGFGWSMVGISGQLLERSIVDRVVGSPERLAFEGQPIVKPPLAQDPGVRWAVATEGETLDTIGACPPLSVVEAAQLTQLLAKEKYRLAGEAARARELYIEKQAQMLVQRTGITMRRAHKIIVQRCNGVLLPDDILPFDDPELAGKTVADVLADPVRFEGESLADPLEGVEYGMGKARIMRRADGSVWIHSFAHGRIVYELRFDFAAVMAALEKADADTLPDDAVRLILAGALEEEEIEKIRNFVCAKTGISKPTMGRKTKEALVKASKQRRVERITRQLAQRRDPRPRLGVPADDAEFVPEMNKLNAILGRDPSAEPPTRNANKVVAQARKIRLPSLHALTSEETNLDDNSEEPTAGTGAIDSEAAE
jgi:hypothetical protein